MSDYNGWANYETWAVSLWIDNEQASYSEWREAAASLMQSHSKDTARYKLADALKREHQDARPEVTGVWADLLGAALSDVDWDEIAESMLAEYVEEEAS